MSDIDDVVTKLGYIEQSLDALAERLPTCEERQAESEQRAWDGAYDKALLAILTRGQLYGAGNPGAGVHSREAQSMDAAAYADAKLEQRRLRFRAGKQDVQPDPDAAPPVPVGNCPRCGIAHYATVGTCGACGWPNPR